MVSAASVTPGIPYTFRVSLGDGVFKLHFSVEHKVGGFLLDIWLVFPSVWSGCWVHN